MYEMESYTVAVIGAGHAGVEAALSCARMGCKTVLFTISLEPDCQHALQSVHRRNGKRAFGTGN